MFALNSFDFGFILYKNWYTESSGYILSDLDRCILQICWKSGVVICSHVDSILAFGTNINVINSIKKFLSSTFEMNFG